MAAHYPRRVGNRASGRGNSGRRVVGGGTVAGVACMPLNGRAGGQGRAKERERAAASKLG